MYNIGRQKIGFNKTHWMTCVLDFRYDESPMSPSLR